MKKFYLLFFLILFFQLNPAFAVLSNNDFISNIEKNLFVYSYPKENLNKRIDRIELNVYGETFANLSTQQRVENLRKIFPDKKIIHKNASTQSNPIINKSISQKQDIQNNNLVNVQNTTIKTYENYPIVDEMERKVFQKTFSGESIYNRLDRLEMAIFQTKTNFSLSDRVEKLKVILLAQQRNINADIDADKAGEAEQLVTALEAQILGTSFQNENLEQRVARLEYSVFNSVSDEEPMLERLERLVSVQQASASSQQINQNAGKLPQQIMMSRIGQIGMLLLLLASLLL